ncbi:hypothetical protein FLM9_640 [Candidatus Synechococcus spongiarum]|uniref:Cytochrome b6-f complex subunit PetM n=1 Tax=Candidatus Synechococcus spongiarum TaxID=431041 RepID=A0A161KB96_9SYNE|nr:hypothetical protein FLM9_640 [Candidatus Synechococcus spongiarum]
MEADAKLLLQSPPCAAHGQAQWKTDLHDHAMAGEIFGTAALFWLLVPVGLIGGLVVLKFQGDNFEN